MEFINDSEYTLIIRYNNKKIPFSQMELLCTASPTYSRLSSGTPVCIIGSKGLSGLLLGYGTLSGAPEYTQTDEINRFTPPYKREYENINVWKFSINILDYPFIDITDEPS